jgi:hypothetical protein
VNSWKKRRPNGLFPSLLLWENCRKNEGWVWSFISQVIVQTEGCSIARKGWTTHPFVGTNWFSLQDFKCRENSWVQELLSSSNRWLAIRSWEIKYGFGSAHCYCASKGYLWFVSLIFYWPPRLNSLIGEAVKRWNGEEVKWWNGPMIIIDKKAALKLINKYFPLWKRKQKSLMSILWVVKAP